MASPAAGAGAGSKAAPPALPRLPQVTKDLFAGTCSGVASILVCHPLDTARTRLQTAEAARFKGVADVFVSTVQREGVRGLYRGMSPPLLSQGIQKAVMFFVFGGATRFFQRQNAAAATAAGTKARPLPLWSVFVSGSAAGGLNALVACPIELVRAKLQVQYNAKGERAAFRGPIDVVRHLWTTGGARALWTGLLPMLYRDVPGVGFWYATFEGSRRALTPADAPRSSLGTLMTAGALAGVGFWVTAFPQDSIKAVIQTRNTAAAAAPASAPAVAGAAPAPTRAPRPLGFLATGQQLLAEGGVKRLYRGFSIAVSRGIPGASITFATYAKVMEHLNANFSS